MTIDPRYVLSGRRILVVEDERLLALDVQDILQSWGCTVLGPVATTAAALRLIAEDPPESAVLDVHLVDGMSEPVAAALQARGRPFLVLTAYQPKHLTGALVGAPLLSKPVNVMKLGQKLSHLFVNGTRG